MVAVSQPGLLAHSYGLPQPPAYSQGVSVQSPVIGVTPSILPPHPPLVTASHFQLPPHSASSQHPPPPPPHPLPGASLLMNLPNPPPHYAGSQPPLTAPGPAAHPSPHGAAAAVVMGNGHVAPHPLLPLPTLPAAALPLTNGQPAPPPPSAPAAASVAAIANGNNPTAAQDAPNGLQMLRTVGMGKYEFTDPGHPKGKPANPLHSNTDQALGTIVYRGTGH